MVGLSTSHPGSCNDSFGTKAPDPGTSLGSGTSPVAFSQLVTGLTRATTCYCCAIASNAGGRAFGGVGSVTTSP